VLKPVRAFIWPVLVAALSIVAGGCSDSTTAPTNFAPFSQTDTVAGTGAEAVSGAAITVDYTGWLYDDAVPDHRGVQFDSSIGRTPFTFTLGTGQVIRGWDQGVVGMKEGGVRRLVIPPSLAYGSNRSGSIPPNSTLIFDISLLSAGTQ
jgi:FKBP-type peptidyl-prolyl cis-trans isomerase FkpA